MYGWRSSSKAWQEHLAKALADLGPTWLQSKPNVYINGNVCIMVYVDDLLFIGEPRRLHASSRRYKPRCYCDTEALVQQARQSTPLVDNYKQRSPLWNFTRRQLHQQHTTRSQPTQSNAGSYTRSNSRSNNFHYNKRGRRAIYPISKNMPNTRAWSESYSGLNTQPDLSFAVKELAGSLQQATSRGQAASPTLPTIPGRYIDSQVCDTTKNTTYINKWGTPWPERVHGSRLGWLSRYTKEHDRFRDPIFGYASALWIPYPGRGSILISRKWVLCRRYRSNRECT